MEGKSDVAPVWISTSVLCRWAAGALVVCRRDAFQEVGGFDQELFALDEIRLSKQLKQWGRGRNLRFTILTKHPLETSSRKNAESIYVDAKDADGKPAGGFSVPPRWAVFIMFERPPIFRQLVANCRGPKNPKCGVSTSNTTYAVITIVGDVTNATLDVSIIR